MVVFGGLSMDTTLVMDVEFGIDEMEEVVESIESDLLVFSLVGLDADDREGRNYFLEKY
jgi:hypothetical protein